MKGRITTKIRYRLYKKFHENRRLTYGYYYSKHTKLNIDYEYLAFGTTEILGLNWEISKAIRKISPKFEWGAQP